MAIHIIDPSKPLPPTYGELEHAFEMNWGDTLILKAGAEIEANGLWADGISGDAETTLFIDGHVRSAQGSGIVTHGFVSIGVTGSVIAAADGVFLYGMNTPGKPHILNNAGSISGGYWGVRLEAAENIVTNSGSISGSIGIEAVHSDQTLVINNTGLIKGTGDAAVSGAYYGSTTIVNQGTIEGDIILGSENDMYDGRGGAITGTIFLGDGDDTAYGGGRSETFFTSFGDDFVDGGAGIDTLFLSLTNVAGTMVNHTVDLRNTEKQDIGTNSSIVLRNVENLVGSNAQDRFIGNEVANTFIGSGGNDILNGYEGNDLLSGGAGDDLLQGGEDSDIAVFTGKFSDYTITVDGPGITITDNRTGGDGVDHLLGVEFALFSDTIYTLPSTGTLPGTPTIPPATPTTPSTPTKPPASSEPSPSTAPVSQSAKSLKLTGGKKADAFTGGKGHDFLNGGLGNDKLIGGEGQDVFAFTTKIGKGNIDRILDFSSADDTIQLSKAIFSKIQKGMLSKEAFHIGTKARDAKDRIIYNAKSGDVLYDADGTGKAYKAIKFANVKGGLSADDFWVV